MEFNKTLKVAQNSEQHARIAIIGAGPAGCAAAYFAAAEGGFTDITIFDFSSPLRTLLCTGGGRCNLGFAEFDFKELAKFYPRGEKFLYSVFSRFSTADTIEFFAKIGVETYVQDDLRIFPTSNSTQDVREKVLNKLKKCTFRCEKVLKVVKEEFDFYLTTDGGSYHFDKVVVAVGGHAGFALAKNLGHKIVEPKPSLVGLLTQKKFNALQGVCVNDVFAEAYFENKLVAAACDDILFTHNGISGPLVYKISALCARLDYNGQNPLLIKLNFLKEEIDFQVMLNSNPKKDIKNLVCEFVPKSFAEFVLNQNKIDLVEKCCNIDGKKRDLILKSLKAFEIAVISPAKEGEVVTSGGVSLDEINPKTMESKLVENLYFCGEVIDVDGFCGGFNLQNCWSTGFVVGSSL